MNVVIIGFKSAGKSTIGPLLAERVGFSFDDLDRRLMEAVAQEAGETLDVRGAYRRLGAERFREMERRLLAEAVKEHRLILSLGGGAALGPSAPDLVRESYVIYIRVPGDELVRRIEAGGWPAYLDGEPNPEAALRRMLGERLPRYEEMADLIIDNPDGESPAKGAEAAATRVLEWMKSRQ
jgi:shikimate kinase